jgi:hypothetical protein
MARLRSELYAEFHVKETQHKLYIYLYIYTYSHTCICIQDDMARLRSELYAEFHVMETKHICIYTHIFTCTYVHIYLGRYGKTEI